MTFIDLSEAPRKCRIPIPEARRGFVANGVALWGLVLACTTIDLLLLPLAGFKVTSEGLLSLNPSIALVLAPVSVFYNFVRYDEGIASTINALAVLIVVTPLLCLFTYIAAALGHDVPLRDPMLAGFDAAIGFDWTTMLCWSDLHPAVVEIGGVAYRSIAVQGAVMVILLSAVAQTERVQVTIYAYVLGAVACGVISALVPAVGTYSFYGVEPSKFAHIDLATRDIHVPDVMALRSGAFTGYAIDAAKGIISFPSFHATLGILFAWSFWRVRWVRWAAFALNAALIAATPLQGSHYLADVLAGIVVAAGAIALAGVLHREVSSLATRATASRPIGMIRFH